MGTPYVPRQLRPYRDPDNGGRWTWERQYEDDEDYVLDVSGLLDTGDTYSAVAEEDVYGVTVGSITVTSAGTLSVRITDGRGTLTAKLTTTAGDEKRVKCAWRTPTAESVDSYI
jgi:hypothetical protein